MSQSPALPPTGSQIWTRSFQCLLWTNWLTAINDNVFRWFVIGVGKGFYEPKDHPYVLLMGTALFVLPYLVFAVPAGWLADRFSKRDVVVVCKFAEIVIMSLAIGALALQNFNLLLIAVFFMGAQSALFAPAKVGKIPELLSEKEISNGNGLFNLATLSAIVIGMAVGNLLSDVTADAAGRPGVEKLWLSASVLIGIAFVGTLISLPIKRLPAARPGLAFPWNVAGSTFRDLRELVRNGPLFRVAMGVAFFWGFASVAQINIDAFADESGLLRHSEKTPLLISVVLGIGFGSVLAGLASRGKIELGLVPWGTIGMILFSLALFFAPEHFLIEGLGGPGKIAMACLMLSLLGICCGFFDVPMASYLQHYSPTATRGTILAATNFMLFGIVMVTSVIYSNGLRAPVRTGSIDRLPPLYREAEDPVKQPILTEKIREAREAIANSSDQASTIVQAVSSAEPATQRALLSHLLFDYYQQQMAKPTETGETNKVDLVATFGSRLPESFLRQITVVNRAVGKQPWTSSRGVFLVMGLATLPVLLISLWRLSRNMIRIGLWWVLKALYRLKITGLDHIPDQGPALIIANHSSWLDGALLLLMSHRPVRAIAWAGNFNSKWGKAFADYAGIILISGGPKSIVQGLKTARQALENGDLVCLFPEGGLSRNSQILGFKPGILKILDGTSAPVIPVYIDEMWGSIFSYSDGKAFRKWPNSIRRAISIQVGQPLANTMSLHEMRQSLMNLGAEAVNQRAGRFISPVELFVSKCKRRLFKHKLGDSTGQKLSGGMLLMRTLILQRLLRRHVLKKNETNVGVLIPPSVGGVIVNMALSLDRRVAINLNYSVSNEIMTHCVKTADIQHVLTTQKVLEKFTFDFPAEVVLLDDLRDKVTLWDKITCGLLAFLCPRWLIGLLNGSLQFAPDDLLTVIFTSGSTGMPKGVMLSHRNVASNVQAIEQVINLNSHDVIVGILPLFHSFGYTVSMWGAMGLNVAGAYHFSPLDARQIGKLVQEFGGTIFLATPTFLRSYIKRCTPEEFKSLQVVVLGAERMPVELADEFEKKYGIRPIEGYGTTELSPLVSVNIPPSRRLTEFQTTCKEGTVGRPIPNVVGKTTHLESGAILGANEPGMLWIKGPNVMLGYLHQEDLTQQSIVDGWYKTGDVAMIDDEGFIKITGRMSRFSKIGGEMVPHVTVEEGLCSQITNSTEEINLAVTAVPDDRKGERLIVLYTTMDKTPAELCAGLSAQGLPNLFIPSQDSFLQVERLPVLGTGKIDLKGLKDLAMARVQGESNPSKG